MIEAGSNPRQHGPSVVRCAEVRSTPSRRPLALAALVLLLAASPTAAQPEPASPEPATPAGPAPIPTSTPVEGRILDGVVAVVDGDPITLRELKRYGVTGAPFLPPEVRNDYRALLESMIEHRLLKLEYEKNGIAASDTMVDRYIESVLEDNQQTRAKLEADIVKAGISWKDYYERMRDEVQRIQLVNLLIRSRVNVPEQEVRETWEKDPQFLESEKLEVAAIFLPAPRLGEEAERAAAQAAEVRREAARNFEAAAKKYSKGLNAGDGGNLGEFTRGSMAPHFEKALAGLKKGDVSEPVEGPGGLFIVKLVGVRSAGRRPFEEVKEELGNQLYDKRLSDRYEKWVTEDLRRDHRIDIMLDKLALLAAGS